MKVIGAILLLTVIGGGLFMFFSSGSNEEKASSQPSSKEAVTYEAIAAEVEAGDAALLDVRTPAEYREGYIAPAENYPLQLLSQGDMPAIAHDETVYLYCRSGNRSAEAAAILTEAGYSNVIDLGGLPDMVNIGGNITAS